MCLQGKQLYAAVLSQAWLRAPGGTQHLSANTVFVSKGPGMLTQHQGGSHEAKENAVLPMCAQHSRPRTEPHVSSRQEDDGWCWFIAPQCCPWVVLLLPSFFPLPAAAIGLRRSFTSFKLIFFN